MCVGIADMARWKQANAYSLPPQHLVGMSDHSVRGRVRISIHDS